MSSFGDLNRVNTNIQSMNAQFSLNKINRDLAQNQLMLATGLRINRAEDDAAGFSMAMTFRARTGGLTEALGNVGDAKGMLDVAEANFDAIFDNLLEMKALATRAGTDSMGEKERADLGAQIAALGQDINEISDQTVYQDKQLLNGDPLTGDAGQTFNFLVGERAQDLVTVSLDRVDMNELFRGSSALQNVSSTDVTDWGLTGGDAATHIAIKVGSTMGSEKHVIKLVDDPSLGGWTHDEITGAAGATLQQEFFETLVNEVNARNIDGVEASMEAVESEAVGAVSSVTTDTTSVEEVLGVYSFDVEDGGAFSAASQFIIAGETVSAGDIVGLTLAGDNTAAAEAIANHINADNGDFDDWTATFDGHTITITEVAASGGAQPAVSVVGGGGVGAVNEDTASIEAAQGVYEFSIDTAFEDGETIEINGATFTYQSDGSGDFDGDNVTEQAASLATAIAGEDRWESASNSGNLITMTEDATEITGTAPEVTVAGGTEYTFTLENTNSEAVSFSLLFTADSSATASYAQVGATNLSVAAADEANNRLEFDQRGSGTDGVWTAADFRSFIADVDSAIVEMTNRVNDVGIAQSSLTKREETLSQSISSNFSAISRIMDTDFAKVQSDSIRLQILQQTATVSLAQANFGPQSVLGFLG